MTASYQKQLTPLNLVQDGYDTVFLAHAEELKVNMFDLDITPQDLIDLKNGEPLSQAAKEKLIKGVEYQVQLLIDETNDTFECVKNPLNI